MIAEENGAVVASVNFVHRGSVYRSFVPLFHLRHVILSIYRRDHESVVDLEWDEGDERTGREHVLYLMRLCWQNSFEDRKITYHSHIFLRRPEPKSNLS